MEVNQLVHFILEMIGIVAFAIAGAMVAIKKKIDIFGVIVLGCVTALGGGITRDIIIGIHPPKLFSDYRFVLVALITSVIVFILAYFLRDKYLKHETLFDSINNFFDAVGLGVFTVSGANVAINSGFTKNGILVVCLGVLTGVGGGVIRDMMLGQIPFILKKRIYALASIVGGVTFYILFTHGMNTEIATIISIVTTFVIRVIATVFKLNLPKVIFKETEQK